MIKSLQQVFKLLLSSALLLLSFSSLGESPSAKQGIVEFKISSLQFFSSFSSFIYFQGDNKSKARLVDAKMRGDQAISALGESDIKLERKWKQITEYVDSYQGYNFDGVDMSLEGGWSILQGELSEIISESETDKISRIENIQMQMETILSQYMAYANSTTGGYGVSYGDTPLEERIHALQKELNDLSQSNEKYQPLLNKWNYIQRTLLAYNSNVAPFVVLHTFDGMRKMIAAY